MEYYKCLVYRDNCAHCQFPLRVIQGMHSFWLSSNFREFSVGFCDTSSPPWVLQVGEGLGYIVLGIAFDNYTCPFHTGPLIWGPIVILKTANNLNGFIPRAKCWYLTSRQSLMGSVELSKGSAHFGSASEWQTQHFILKTIKTAKII